MSLSGALSSAITGLSAQSQALAMVSDNIANSSTTGYKTTDAMFDDLVTNTIGSQQYSSGGVTVTGRTAVTQQGLLTTTTNPTDVAIQGQGFFVVQSGITGGQTSYTRDGAFTIDNQGYLVNNGQYLMGWRTDSQGNITGGGGTLQPIDTSVAAVSGSATTQVSIAANLPADAAIGATFTSSLPIYDSLGESSTVEVTWTKSASNTWGATFANPVAVTNSAVSTGTSSGSLSITFNSDGSLASTTPNPPTFSITGWTDGATDSSIQLKLGTAGGTDGLTQYSSGLAVPQLSVTGINSDGLAFGKLSSVSMGANGLVNASYSNGQTIPIYKIPLATFVAPDSLSPQSDGLYTATVASGAPTIEASGTGGAGVVYGSELESSTTNTNQEFSTMMNAQQAYSASAQVVTAVNKMFDTLISAMR